MLRELFRQVSGVRKLFAFSIGLGLGAGMLLILEAAWIADIADRAFLRGSPLAPLLPAFGVLLLWIALRAVLQTAGEHASAQMALRIKGELRVRLIAKLAELGPRSIGGERSGELLGTVHEGVEQLEAYLSKYLPQVALSMLVPAAVFAVALRLDLISAVVLAVTMPLLVLFMILVGVAAKSKAARQFKQLGRLGGHFLDVVRGLPTLKAFGRSRAQIEIIDRLSDDYRRETMGTLRLAFLSAFVMELFATLSTAVVAVFLGLRLADGGIGFEQAFLVLLLTPEFYAPVRAVGTQFHASAAGMSAIKRIVELLGMEGAGWPERTDGRELPSMRSVLGGLAEAAGADDAGKAGRTIELRDVSVRYPGAERDAVSGLSLTIRPGLRVAGIGPTGAGMCSLLDLLQGFVRPTAGAIYIDGVDMAELSMAAWREELSGVPQQPKLFPGTVRDNVAYGRPDATEAEVLRALELSGSADVVAALPQGLDTVLGESARLSGGQQQRQAIARALLKDAPLLLLDEPTAGLDAMREAELRRTLDTLLRGRMSVTVAHRLETVQGADLVVVLADGRLAEIGTPAQLLAANGLYARLSAASRGEEKPTLSAVRQPPVAVDEAAPLQSDLRKGEAAPAWAGGAPESTTTPGAGAGESANREPDGDTGAHGGSWRRLLGFLRPYKGRLALAALLGFATVAANVGLMGTSGYLIAKAALRPETVLLLFVPIVGVRFFGISRGVLRYLERLASHDLTFRILQRIRVWLYERLERGGVSLLERRSGGDVLGVMMSDVEQLQNLYLRVIAPPIVAALTALLGTAVLAAFDPYLGAIVGGMLLVAGVGLPWIGFRAGRRTGRELAAGRGHLYAETADLLAGLTEAAIFGRTRDRIDRIAAGQTRLDRLQTGLNRLGAFTNGAMLASAHVTLWLVLLCAAWLTANGRLEGLYIPAVAMIALACFEAVTPLPAAFQQLGHTMESAERLFAMADEAEAAGERGLRKARTTTADAGQETAAASRGPAASQRGVPALPGAVGSDWALQVRGLSCRYSPDAPYALRDLSLTLRPGRRIAVVGPSGAGKSTLLQCLLGLREADGGSIRLNGCDLTETQDGEAALLFAFVSQRVQLFNASAADNIRLGRPDASDEDLRRAASQALIDEKLSALPEGYDTVIGEWGASLSGGERQRLALARALLLDAPAILFDEPETGLDALTARAFEDNMETALKDKAVLWATHRLSGLARMDEILVLDQGSVRERGNHAELLRARGLYWRMWRLEREQDWQEEAAHIATA
ncbi:thiol reductant ABC exporter subunit CydD [Cohnella sp. GbtcB17]|uniref:thiol reductant ABC exporter subunit CydD n=1 Tax=Cohnella sp. GbtcB17 TaxID=2824762 RepID=UPI001C2FED69|nr:thiol reductant ABC exporter subunit CydD [Cohnella sp. GbtcB17]